MTPDAMHALESALDWLEGAGDNETGEDTVIAALVERGYAPDDARAVVMTAPREASVLEGLLVGLELADQARPATVLESIRRKFR